MSAQISRKQLKHDEFVDTATALTRWLMQRRRRIGLALLAGVVVVSVIAGVRLYQDRREQKASALLAVAMEIYRAPLTTEPVAAASATDLEAAAPGSTGETGEGAAAAAEASGGQQPPISTAGEAGPDAEVPATATEAPATPTAAESADEQTEIATGADEHGAAGHQHYANEQEKFEAARAAFRDVVDNYGRTPSGRLASFYLGLCEAELGNNEAAIEALGGAAAASQPLIGSMAMFRLGLLQLEIGDTESAISSFDRLLAQGGDLFPKEEALMSKARAHELAGDRRAALSAYQQVVDDYGDSFAANEARQRVEELAAQLGLDPEVQG